MSLKEDIVVVNEYTTKTKSGGTRGGTPGKYVTRYMAREAAVEPLLFSVGDGYVMRYMARPGAVEHLYDDEALYTKDLTDSVAFGSEDMSLSAKDLKSRSDEIQNCFDDGKTIFKTVFSFTDEYLHRTGVVSDDFEFHSKGDYRGHIDQVKLRKGIMAAMDAIGRYHDDWRYVGVIQVDTSHVHCHICAVDRGKGNIVTAGKFKGQQRGNLSMKEISAARRAMDNVLSPRKNLKKLYVQKDELVNEMKKLATVEHILYAQDMQMLVNILPSNTKMWRAKSNAKEMKRPNQMLRTFVHNTLLQSSYYDLFRKDIHEIAMYRKNREGLTDKEVRDIESKSERALEDQLMNRVYRSLKRKKPKKTKSTKYLHEAKEDVKDYKDTSGSYTDMFRSYNRWYELHKQQEDYWSKMLDLMDTSQMNEHGRKFYEYAKTEYAYQKALHEKYTYILTFLRAGELDPNKLDEYYKTLSDVQACERMMNDETLRSGKDMGNSGVREAYGFTKYGVAGGSKVGVPGDTTDPDSEAYMHQQYLNALARRRAMIDEYLASYNLRMDDTGELKPNMTDEHFHNINPMDLHKTRTNRPVKKAAWKRFYEVAEDRVTKFKDAMDYLRKTKQDKNVYMPQDDVDEMERVLHQMRPFTEEEVPSKEDTEEDSIAFSEEILPSDEMVQESIQSITYEIKSMPTDTILADDETSDDLDDDETYEL